MLRRGTVARKTPFSIFASALSASTFSPSGQENLKKKLALKNQMKIRFIKLFDWEKIAMKRKSWRVWRFFILSRKN